MQTDLSKLDVPKPANHDERMGTMRENVMEEARRLVDFDPLVEAVNRAALALVVFRRQGVHAEAKITNADKPSRQITITATNCVKENF